MLETGCRDAASARVFAGLGLGSHPSLDASSLRTEIFERLLLGLELADGSFPRCLLDYHARPPLNERIQSRPAQRPTRRRRRRHSAASLSRVLHILTPKPSGSGPTRARPASTQRAERVRFPRRRSGFREHRLSRLGTGSVSSRRLHPEMRSDRSLAPLFSDRGSGKGSRLPSFDSETTIHASTSPAPAIPRPPRLSPRSQAANRAAKTGSNANRIAACVAEIRRWAQACPKNVPTVPIVPR